MCTTTRSRNASKAVNLSQALRDVATVRGVPCITLRAGWPAEAYALIGRADMATAAAAAAAAAVAPVAPAAVAAAVLPSLGTPAGLSLGVGATAWTLTPAPGRRPAASDTPMRQPQLRTPAAGGAAARLALTRLLRDWHYAESCTCTGMVPVLLLLGVYAVAGSICIID